MKETLHLELKKTFGKEVIITLVAFANTEGGAVLVGVLDDGTPCGTDIGAETVQRFLNEIKMSTYPQLIPKILIEEREGKQVIRFEVCEFPIKPVSYKNRYYCRVHNSNHVMTLEEIVDLQQQSLSISYDAYPSSALLSDLDSTLLARFMDRVNKRGRVSLRDDLNANLVKLKLVRDGKLTIAANLLFGDPDFTIRIGRFKSEATIIDDIAGLFCSRTLCVINRHVTLKAGKTPPHRV
ncbi:MAG: RNA-binding domain-containing protein [Pedobacter sp.]